MDDRPATENSVCCTIPRRWGDNRLNGFGESTVLPMPLNEAASACSVAGGGGVEGRDKEVRREVPVELVVGATHAGGAVDAIWPERN